jgi:bifunctional UDP-N-acetylglucosamine pyrophosphorylase / glucosamine-1-phosphate N-acetyltransferase
LGLTLTRPKARSKETTGVIMTKSISAVVLAAGKSSRFKTESPKLLAKICGQKMILYPLQLLKKLSIATTVVVGYKSEEVVKSIRKAEFPKVDFVVQEQQLGTGHAAACSKHLWDKDLVLILNGDAPLISEELINDLIETHVKSKATASIASAFVDDSNSYGRVISKNGKIKIVEAKDCTTEEIKEPKINAGIYLFSKDFLKSNVEKLEQNNAAQELYLTDLVSMASDQGLHVNVVSAPYDVVRGVNNLEELWAVEQIKRSELMRHWMQQGVRFGLAQNIHIDMGVKIGAGTFVGSSVILIGKIKIGKNCRIHANTIVENSTIGDETIIHANTIVKSSVVGKKCSVGPFAHVQQNSILEDGSKIGNFVEVTRSTICSKAKAKHLAYIGDTQLGANSNIGAGTIICNYDGKEKHRTVIGANAFIGSNNTIVAPLTIGKDAITAGGSTITENVPGGSLGIGRSRQINKLDYKQTKKKDEKPLAVTTLKPFKQRQQ